MSKRPRRIIILEAAGRLFCHYGPFKTTVADIAKEARVGVGSVYLEFQNKEAILQALSGRRHSTVLVAQRTAWAKGGAPRDRLRRVFHARLDAFLTLGEQGAHGPDLLACESPAVERAHEAFEREETTQLAGFLAEGGEIEGPAELAQALIQAHLAFTPPHVFRSTPSELRAQLSHLHRLLFEDW